MKNNEDLIKKLLKYIGPVENIISINSCMTRTRIEVKDEKLFDVEQIKNLEEVHTVICDKGYFQIVLGPGKATKVANILKESLGLETNLKEYYKAKNNTFFKNKLKEIASIFVPILPAIIACGLVMGLNNVALKTIPNFNSSFLGGILSVIGVCAFAALPILVGVSSAKVFGGNIMIGGALASLLTLPQLSSVMFLGKRLVPGRGGIIAVLLVVAFSSWLEKKIRVKMPETLDILLTPLFTVLIAGIISLTLLQPIGGYISDFMTLSIKKMLIGGGPITGFIMAALWLPLVMTGLHQSIIPIHAELLETIKYTPLLPIFAMVGPGQIGAVLCVYFTTKNQRLKKVIKSGIPVQIMGIGEPLIYGVTLPLFRPFIAACISAGLGGALAVYFNLNSLGMGLSGFPLTLMLNKPLLYLLIMILIIPISFIITKIIGFNDIDA